MGSNIAEKAMMEVIYRADPALLEEILDAVICRYAILYPDWDVHVFSLERSADPRGQIDTAIRLLGQIQNQI